MDLISLMLRLEIGIAFVFFPYPISLLVGIAFSITNELAVKYNRITVGLIKKASILIIFSIVNALIFAIGAFFQGNFIMHRGTERAYVSYENIKWYIQGILCVALAMMLWRMFFLGITVLSQMKSKTKDKSQHIDKTGNSV